MCLLVLLDPPVWFIACLCVDLVGATPSSWTPGKKVASETFSTRFCPVSMRVLDVPDLSELSVASTDCHIKGAAMNCVFGPEMRCGHVHPVLNEKVAPCGGRLSRNPMLFFCPKVYSRFQ
jgi:hypothetical protein